MATINIGSLTFTHKGDYASGTAYVKNDVVYYSTNGNAYIAKQATQGNAPTNATYWNQFAQGSGGIWNAGLSLGSAGQAVKVNSSGNALEFGAVGGGKVLQVVQETVDDAYSFTHTSFAEVNSAFRKSITPTASTSKILVLFSVHTSFNHSTQQVPAYYKIQRKIGSGSYGDISLPSTNLGSRSACHFMQPNIQTGTGENCDHSTVTILDTPNTTQAVGYTILSRIRGTGSGFVNRMGNDDNNADQSRYLAYWTFIEIGA
jgi:hypothetical protein